MSQTTQIPENINVIPGESLGPFRVGRTLDEITADMGSIPEAEKDDDGDLQVEIEPFTLYFGKDDGFRLSLVSFEVAQGHTVTFRGEGMPTHKDGIYALLSRHAMRVEEEREILDQILLEVQDASVSFFFEDDSLFSVMVGPRVDENDVVVWPIWN